MGNSCKFSDIKDLEIDSSDKAQSDEESEYLKNEFREIKEFRKKVVNMNVFKRKQIAKEEYKIFLENEDKIKDNDKYIDKDKIKSKYIQIMCLILIDNTNKDIVKLYLNFIKNHPSFIKENKLLPYKKEINKYKIIFKIKEINQIEKNIKNKSQKDIFLDYLKDIVSIDLKNNSEIVEFLKETKAKLNKLFLFNTPIEFNNKELYFYKCYYNLLYENSKQENGIKAYLKNKQKIINYIMKKNLYDSPLINSNEDKMNLLTLYLLNENFYSIYNEDELINFNRLIQSMPVTKEDFQETNKESTINKLITIDEIDYIEHKISSKNKRENIITIPLEKVCCKNLINSKLKEESEEQIFYNLDTLLVENDLSPYIEDIKKFLIKIVDSNVYKQAIKKLFPKYYNYLSGNEDIKQHIKERIKFYPFQNLFLSGITDKFSCYTYITSINFIPIFILDSDNKDTYKIGLTITNCIHEINHTNQILIYFKGNEKDLINSPEREFEGIRIKEDKIKITEGGMSIEYILFGKSITEINLLECLYIMNEENYNQNLNEFKENFMNIKEIVKESNGDTKFIKIENGIFKSFYQKSIKEIESIITLLNTSPDGFTPSMSIGKVNKDLNNENFNIPKKKCAVFGGWKKFQ